MSDPRLDRPLFRGRTNVDAYTIAWILHAEAIVRERWPKLAHELQITKGGYQPAADKDSADTHTRGGATDFVWCHPECLRALRAAGGFAWHRTPAQGDWAHHIHGAPLGHPDMAPGLARQEAGYLAGRNGLANNGPDDGPRLNPIPRPTWPWPEEDTVNADDIKAIAAETTKQLLAAKVSEEGPTVKAALRRAAKSPDLIEDLEEALTTALEATLNDASSDHFVGASPDAIRDAVKQALREGTL